MMEVTMHNVVDASTLIDYLIRPKDNTSIHCM